MELIRCTRCVMDNSSDKTITFDKNGHCNYCTYNLKRKQDTYFPNKEGEEKLQQLVHKLKEEGKGKEYDCLMGISGGLDSSYLAYLGYKHGLRILAFHINDGFNTEIAESNIRNLCEKCNIDLKIETPDQEQFTDVIKAFFLAGVPGICNAQDNIIFSYLYKNALKYNIHNFLSGANFSLESILQRGDGINASDGYHIKSISKLYGTKGIDKLPIMSIFDSYVMAKYRYKLKKYKPLNYISYNRNQAIEELENFCGFNYYGGKHSENLLTHFAQVYYLPKKFGIDKRTSHLSSMIISDQISREEALIELEKPVYNEKEILDTIEFISKKFEMTTSQFLNVIEQAPKSHFDYPYSYFNKLSPLARNFRKLLFD